MKKKIKIFGNIILVAVFLSLLTTCENDSGNGPLDGVWFGFHTAVNRYVMFTLTGYNWLAKSTSGSYGGSGTLLNNLARGTFEIDGDTITFKQTHGVNNNTGAWVSLPDTVIGIFSEDEIVFLDSTFIKFESPLASNSSSTSVNLGDDRFNGSFERVTEIYGTQSWIFDGTSFVNRDGNSAWEIALRSGFLFSRNNPFQTNWLFEGAYSFSEDGNSFIISTVYGSGQYIFTKQ